MGCLDTGTPLAILPFHNFIRIRQRVLADVEVMVGQVEHQTEGEPWPRLTVQL